MLAVAAGHGDKLVQDPGALRPGARSVPIPNRRYQRGFRSHVDPPPPSATWRVTVAVPTWLASGVQVTNPVPESTDRPCGPETRENVSESLSGSVAVAW